MSSIHSVGSNLPLQSYGNAVKSTASATASPSTSTDGTDSVEISGTNRYLDLLKTNAGRPDKVASVRSAIENGSYDADGSKLDGALDGLLDDLNL